MPLHAHTEQRFRSQHLLLDSYLKGQESRMDVEIWQGKWTLREVVAHLARYQEIFEGRINLILKNENPPIPRYRAEFDEGMLPWLELTSYELLQRLHIKRDTLIRQVIGLPLGKLARAGEHPSWGKMDIPELTEFFVLHEAHHLFQIFKMVRANEPA